jgi:plastocyanin
MSSGSPGRTSPGGSVRKGLLALAAMGLSLAACGSGGSDSVGAGTPACRPDGHRLSLVARNGAFDADCLAAHSGTRIEVAFDNQDGGVQHNLAVLSEDPAENPAARVLFKGQIVQGPDMITYRIPVLASGTYHFRCDVHPVEMQGVYVVE